MSKQCKSPAAGVHPVSGRRLRASDNIMQCLYSGELSKRFRVGVAIRLEDAGVLTFEDLSRMTDLELAKIPGCGFTHIIWLQLALKERGLELARSRD